MTFIISSIHFYKHTFFCHSGYLCYKRHNVFNYIYRNVHSLLTYVNPGIVKISHRMFFSSPQRETERSDKDWSFVGFPTDWFLPDITFTLLLYHSWRNSQGGFFLGASFPLRHKQIMTWENMVDWYVVSCGEREASTTQTKTSIHWKQAK